MAVIGYARVSSDEQHLDLQIDALQKAGCDEIFTDDGISAVAKHRPGLEAALDTLNDGDSFVIWKLDRAFRSMRHALDIWDFLKAKNIIFVSVTEQIDTGTAHGKCQYQIRAVFAEYELNLNSERTKAGMLAAKLRGKHIGRKYALSDEQIAEIRDVLRRKPDTTIVSLAKAYGVCTHTITRSLKRKASKRS
ncbi:recombinase family protein [Aliikangiella sp. IMCC44359]|uniref:recombinase family protein n=1 Tax=Aliikangiella sp. IMCC44359 TaxID=3459125 RepID=UPI00403AF57D